jgi:uncharacterized damage-inducible protein DinB
LPKLPRDELRPSARRFPDTTLHVDVSLELLDALQTRWLAVLRALREEQFSRTLMHPEGGPMSIDALVSYYAWHGPHHVAHIRALAGRMGW